MVGECPILATCCCCDFGTANLAPTHSSIGLSLANLMNWILENKSDLEVHIPRNLLNRHESTVDWTLPEPHVRHGVCVIFDDPPCDANLQEMVPRGPRSGDDSRWFRWDQNVCPVLLASQFYLLPSAAYEYRLSPRIPMDHLLWRVDPWPWRLLSFHPLRTGCRSKKCQKIIHGIVLAITVLQLYVYIYISIYNWINFWYSLLVFFHWPMFTQLHSALDTHTHFRHRASLWTKQRARADISGMSAAPIEIQVVKTCRSQPGNFSTWKP